MGKKKVIILYSTGGMGHAKAAKAIYKAFQDKGADVEVKILDVLEYGNRFFKFAYKDFYVFLMSHARWLWGALYYFTNLPLIDSLTRRIRGIMDLNNLPGLGKRLVEEDADAIIATHYLLPSIAWILKKNEDFHAELYTLITDYGPHSYWLSDYIDRFFVGSESALHELTKRKVPALKINITGIPTDEEFTVDLDKEKLQEVHKVDKSKKTVLLMSGGFGVGPIKKILQALNLCKADIQVITVCGHNKEVYEDVDALRGELKYPVILFGFTDKVAELMTVSDLIITKAGGISVTESLNMRLPMILFASVPGQETWNEDLLVSSRAAEKAKKVTDIPVIANRILLSDDVAESMKSGIEKIRRPDAAKKVVDIVLKEMGEGE